MDDCLRFDSDPELVTAARQFVRDRLTSWEARDHLDAALLVTSELVTNAILHARTEVELRLEVGGDRVRIEVLDGNPRLPVTSSCPPDATSGRGLPLVAAVASRWGVESRDDGKVVWAELGAPNDPAPDDGCVDLVGVLNVDQAVAEINRSELAQGDRSDP